LVVPDNEGAASVEAELQKMRQIQAELQLRYIHFLFELL
jgi:hypothetical protein